MSIEHGLESAVGFLVSLYVLLWLVNWAWTNLRRRRIHYPDHHDGLSTRQWPRNRW